MSHKERTRAHADVRSSHHISTSLRVCVDRAPNFWKILLLLCAQEGGEVELGGWRAGREVRGETPPLTWTRRVGSAKGRRRPETYL